MLFKKYIVYIRELINNRINKNKNKKLLEYQSEIMRKKYGP